MKSPVRGKSLDFDFLNGLLGYQIRRAQLAVFDDFAVTMAPLELTPGQLGALVLIGANPGCKQTEIGSALGFDRSSFVALLDRLEARRLLVRRPSPHDRRSHALHLSAAGATLLTKARPLLQRHERQLSLALSAREQTDLLRLLSKIAPASSPPSRPRVKGTSP